MSSLAGACIVVTRSSSSAEALAEEIRVRGGRPHVVPAIDIRSAESTEPLVEALRDLSSYDVVVFTSRNAVRFTLSALRANSVATSELGRLSIIAIGPKTARLLESEGLRVTLVPSDASTDGLLAELRNQNHRGRRYLIPRSSKASQKLPETLRQWGGVVDFIEAYRTVEAPENSLTQAREYALHLESGGCASRGEVWTFFSPSSVRGFFSLLECAAIDWRAWSVRPLIAAIGPTTASALSDRSMAAEIIPEQTTQKGLLNAIARKLRTTEG